MKESYGFVRIAAAVPEVRVADTAFNTEQTVALVKEAASAGVQVVVFPECNITGYTVNDLYHQEALQLAAVAALKTVCEETRDSHRPELSPA